MFDNIGSKIQALAKIVCWIGIVITAFIGFMLIATGEDIGFLGALLMFFGPLSSWVGSCFLYGFGELIEKTAEIAQNTRCSNTNNENISNNHNKVEPSNKPQTKKCPHCGIEHDFNDSKCPNCGYQVRIIKKGEEGNIHYNE